MYNLEGGVIWTQELKNAFKTGTTYCSVIHNQQEYNESNFLKEAELKDVKYVPNAGFIGQAVSKMLTIKMVNDEESNLNFENANVQFKIGAKYNDIIYYINYGNFIVNEPPENDDTNGTVKFIAYDYMIKFNQDYTNRVSYPCTLKDLLLDICSQAGVELGSTTFQNEDFEVEDNQFEGKQLRDVLQHIAKCAFSWARIGQDNKLYLDFEVNNNINETITIDDYKMDAFKKANEYYGAINKVTYADSDIKGQEISVQDDSSIATYGEKEIIIYDNYFAYNIEKRQELIQAGTALFGLRYMPVQNLELIGLVYLDCTDIIGVQDGAGTTYLTRVFSHIIKYNGAVSDTIETTGESDNEKRYSNPNNSIAQNSRTEIIVDRAKKEITAVVEEVAGQNQKIAQVTQTVDELRSQISDIADITTSLESNSARLEFENINQSEPIRVVIHPVGTNISKLYPSPSLKPSSNLKIRTRILRFTNTTTQQVWNYELPDDLLYYDNENYDEFQLDYEAQTCIINKKCKWNNDGTVGLLANERTDEYTFPHIELTDGDYTVQLIQYNSGYIFARMMTKNYYTDQFATRAELNSEISQTVDNINLSVNERLTNYSTTSQMNSAIDLKASEITSSVSNTYATKSELSSSTSSLNSKIDQTAQSISLTVDSVQEQVETAQSTADTATTKADNAQSSANSAQSTANLATTKADNAQTTANNAQTAANNINTNLTTNYYTKTQTNSAIDQKADSITSTVSQTYSTKTETTAAKNAAINSANAATDTKLQSYSTTTQMNSAINQKANEISTTVSNTYSTKTETSNAINNIKIGGANLLRFTQSGENWTKTSFDAQELTFTRATTATTEATITHPKNYLTLEKNTQYTLSAWIKSNGYVKSVDFFCYDKNTDHPQSKLNISVNTNWQFVSWTFTTNNYSNSDYSQTTIRFDNNGSTSQGTNAILYVKKPKLEIGNKATDWQPSLEDYSTTIEMNSAITQTSDTIMTSVNQKVGKTEVGTYIEQNTESVKLAWNQISEYIQMMIINNNASFAILDSSKKPIAYFDKTGIHFSSNNTAFGEMGVQTVDGNKFIAFSVDGTYGSAINNGMAWGIKTTTDNKFHPIFYIKNFEMGSQQSDTGFGELVLSASNLLLDGIGTGLIAGTIKIFGDPTQGDLYFYDIKNNKYPLIITPENDFSYGEISILDNIRFYKVENGENRLMIGAQGEGCQLTDTGAIICDSLSISSGGFGIICDNNITAYGGGTFNSIRCYGNIHCDGNVYAQNVSDRRLKKNIKDVEDNALDNVKKMKVRSFDWKKDDSHVSYGFIAQELEEIDECYVLKQEIKNDKGEITDYKYYQNEFPIIATLTKAIQEQQAQIEELQKEIKELKGGTE